VALVRALGHHLGQSQQVLQFAAEDELWSPKSCWDRDLSDERRRSPLPDCRSTRSVRYPRRQGIDRANHRGPFRAKGQQFNIVQERLAATASRGTGRGNLCQHDLFPGSRCLPTRIPPVLGKPLQDETRRHDRIAGQVLFELVSARLGFSEPGPTWHVRTSRIGQSRFQRIPFHPLRLAPAGAFITPNYRRALNGRKP